MQFILGAIFSMMAANNFAFTLPLINSSFGGWLPKQLPPGMNLYSNHSRKF